MEHQISINEKEHELLQLGLSSIYEVVQRHMFEEEDGKLVGEGKDKKLKMLGDIENLKAKIRMQFPLK